MRERGHVGQAAQRTDGQQGPTVAKPSTARVYRADLVRQICAERGVSVRRLAQIWGVCPSRAHQLLTRDTGPSSERLAQLPPGVQAELGARLGAPAPDGRLALKRSGVFLRPELPPELALPGDRETKRSA